MKSIWVGFLFAFAVLGFGWTWVLGVHSALDRRAAANRWWLKPTTALPTVAKWHQITVYPDDDRGVRVTIIDSADRAIQLSIDPRQAIDFGRLLRDVGSYKESPLPPDGGDWL